MAELSAAKFMPATEHPAELAKAIRLQAVWIEGQGKTNQAHWEKIRELESDCANCRNDRRLADEFVMARLNQIDMHLQELRSDKRWTVLVVRGLFAVATLLIAAKAAGVFH